MKCDEFLTYVNKVSTIAEIFGEVLGGRSKGADYGLKWNGRFGYLDHKFGECEKIFLKDSFPVIDEEFSFLLLPTVERYKQRKRKSRRKTADKPWTLSARKTQRIDNAETREVGGLNFN